MSLSNFDKLVHGCTKCKETEVGYAIKYYPIISFGNPRDKPILVIGLNPSTREYEDGYVSNSQDIQERHQTQMNYFKKKPYTFFKNLAKYFQPPVRSKLGWVRNPWEKVGYLDIVKCPVRAHPRASSQWGSLRKRERDAIIGLCSPYLLYQLEYLTPKLVMAYGADVCRWFYPAYSVKDAFTVRKCIVLEELEVNVILVPQTRGSHPTDVIEKLKNVIAQQL